MWGPPPGAFLIYFYMVLYVCVLLSTCVMLCVCYVLFVCCWGMGSVFFFFKTEADICYIVLLRGIVVVFNSLFV